LIDLEKRLHELPVLRSAFLLGALRRARLREVVRVATPETESAWLLLARSLTSAELRARVRAARGDAETAEPSSERDRVAIRVSPEEAVFIESIGLPMLRCVIGQEGPKHVLMKHLVAEVLTELGPAEVAEGSCKSPSKALRRKVRAHVKAQARQQRLLQRLGGEPEVAWPVASGSLLGDRLDHVRALAQWRRSIDWQRARLLALFERGRWHVERGHGSFAEWLDRRLGLAPREAAMLKRLAASISDLPAIEQAWRSGEMTARQAEQVARVAVPTTDIDWAAFVQRATGKRLDVEIAAHAAMRVHLGDDEWRLLTDGGRPLWDETMITLRMEWVKVFQQGAAQGSCNPSEKTTKPTPLAMAAGRRRPLPVPATFSFEGPAEVVADFRLALQRIHEDTGRVLDPAGCLLQMFTRFAAVHVVNGIKFKSMRERALRRDGFTCSMPHCRSKRNLEIHHVKYRAHQGTNDRWNVTVLCHACHLLQHAGHVRITREGIARSRAGLAPALVVRVGRRPEGLAETIYAEGIRTHHWESKRLRERSAAA
jgi:hypothetical protein